MLLLNLFAHLQNSLQKSMATKKQLPTAPTKEELNRNAVDFLCSVVMEEVFLMVVRMFCDWLQANQIVIATCAQVRLYPCVALHHVAFVYMVFIYKPMWYLYTNPCGIYTQTRVAFIYKPMWYLYVNLRIWYLHTCIQQTM